MCMLSVVTQTSSISARKALFSEQWKAYPKDGHPLNEPPLLCHEQSQPLSCDLHKAGFLLFVRESRIEGTNFDHC